MKKYLCYVPSAAMVIAFVLLLVMATVLLFVQAKEIKSLRGKLVQYENAPNSVDSLEASNIKCHLPEGWKLVKNALGEYTWMDENQYVSICWYNNTKKAEQAAWDFIKFTKDQEFEDIKNAEQNKLRNKYTVICE